VVFFILFLLKNPNNLKIFSFDLKNHPTDTPDINIYSYKYRELFPGKTCNIICVYDIETSGIPSVENYSSLLFVPEGVSFSIVDFNNEYISTQIYYLNTVSDQYKYNVFLQNKWSH
jgi:hypothetical protein